MVKLYDAIKASYHSQDTLGKIKIMLKINRYLMTMNKYIIIKRKRNYYIVLVELIILVMLEQMYILQLEN